MKKITLALLLPVFLAVGVSAYANVEELKVTCNGCHGDNGVSSWSDMPTIAGIDAFVHSEALYMYKDNARPCADSEFRQGDTSRAASNMCKVAGGIADEDIEAISAYYAAQPFVAAKQAFDAELAAAGKAIHDRDCEVCHSAGGSDAEDEASILAGQWIGYLRHSFAQYRAGEREQPPTMQQKIDALSDAEVESLVQYYASQQ
jgi:sulfide dehydrogenase cytochrome subunit